MTETLADRFREGKTAVVDHEGRPTHAVLGLDVFDGTTISIEVLAANAWREQLFNLHTPSAELESAAGERARSFTMQCTDDTGTVEFLVHVEGKPHQPVTLHLWNGWAIGAIDHAWAGNAGLQITAESDHAWILECSDGVGSADFDDLHLRLELIPPDEGTSER